VSDGIQATLIGESEIIAYLPASYFERGGIYPITVENPYPANVESNVQLLAVYYPPPAVDMVFPSSTPVKLELGASSLDILVLGYGFRRGAVVTFNNTPLITSYCETNPYCLSTRLYAKVPAELLQRAGFAQIEVLNPDPALPNTMSAHLRIDGLQPTITSVMPGSATLTDTPFGFNMPIVVNGTNFSPETWVRVYPMGSDPIPPFTKARVEILSSSQLFITMVMSYPESLGDWIVEVANPAPGGGVSDPVNFTITEGSFAANPFLISLSPQTVGGGGPAFTLTVNGTNFRAGTVVYFNYTPLVTTVVSDRQVRAQVPASLIRTAGRVPISVINPDTGGSSNRLFLDIR
jgi:hypothetical protein